MEEERDGIRVRKREVYRQGGEGEDWEEEWRTEGCIHEDNFLVPHILLTEC